MWPVFGLNQEDVYQVGKESLEIVVLHVHGYKN
jgi:hypothetical protein